MSTTTGSSRGGGGHGASSASVLHYLPASTKKVVQDLKEVVGNSEEEIYAMLKECNMDPNETAQRLLNQAVEKERNERLLKEEKERNERLLKEEKERNERLLKEEKERYERLLKEKEKQELVNQIMRKKNEGLRKTLHAKSRK